MIKTTLFHEIVSNMILSVYTITEQNLKFPLLASRKFAEDIVITMIEAIMGAAVQFIQKNETFAGE